jgi:hypothetical protein
VRAELTIPVFEQAKAVHALNPVATLTNKEYVYSNYLRKPEE